MAIERSGRDVVLLSTAIPAARLREIGEREKLAVIIADAEFGTVLADSGSDVEVWPADGPDAVIGPVHPRVRACLPPRRRSKMIMLTSGTTGPPKGAQRTNRAPAARDLGLLDAIPLALNDVTLVASPLFHAWGLAQMTVALATGSTILLRRKFDPVETLQAMQDHDVTVLAVVPLMLRRILDSAPADLQLPHLRLTLCSGNVLGPGLASDWIDRFGLNLYNIYGSTETSIASITTPADLVEAPGTVGRAPEGVTIAILTDEGLPTPPGELGHVYTANGMQFDGYTDGTDRTRQGSLMATGDLGFFDDGGRLFVDGRENDLIVTGGENVFPSEIEEILEGFDEVEQAAVVGLPDEEYGQRVVAFIVSGDSLDEDALRTWLQDKLATYKQPREYRVVDALPMTTTGKVVRHALATLGRSENI